MNGETNMMDECLKSGILLYTLNFAIARPIAFTSLRIHVHTIPLSVSYYCYHLVAAPRRARQVCFSQFLLDTLPRAAGPYTGVLLEVQRDLTIPYTPSSSPIVHVHPLSLSGASTTVKPQRSPGHWVAR